MRPLELAVSLIPDRATIANALQGRSVVCEVLCYFDYQPYEVNELLSRCVDEPRVVSASPAEL